MKILRVIILILCFGLMSGCSSQTQSKYISNEIESLPNKSIGLTPLLYGSRPLLYELLSIIVQVTVQEIYKNSIKF